MPITRQSQKPVTSPVVLPRQIPDPPQGTVDTEWWGQLKAILRDHQTQITTLTNLLAKINTLT